MDGAHECGDGEEEADLDRAEAQEGELDRPHHLEEAHGDPPESHRVNKQSQVPVETLREPEAEPS